MSGETIATICTIIGTGISIAATIGALLVRAGRRHGEVAGGIAALREDVGRSMDSQRRIWERLDNHDRRITRCETLLEVEVQ